MKKALSLVLVLMLVIAMVPFGVFAELAKDGDVYLIGSAADLVEFKNLVNSSPAATRLDAKLTADIDMSSVTDWQPIGNHNINNGPTENNGYLGSFDGDGHTISNLNVTLNEGNWNSGSFSTALLFGVLGNGGGFESEVKNFTLKDSSLTINGTEGKEIFVGGVCNNLNRAKILGLTLDNVDIVAKGAFSGGAIGLLSQAATWPSRTFNNCTIKENCSITTETSNVGLALVVGRTMNGGQGGFEVKDGNISGTLNAPEGGRKAAIVAFLGTNNDFSGTVNNTEYPEIDYGPHEWVYQASNRDQLQSALLNDKVDLSKISDDKDTIAGITGWGESYIKRLFTLTYTATVDGQEVEKDGLFGDKFAGNFGGSKENPAVILFETTEPVTVGSYGWVTGGDSASYTDRNVKTFTFFGSTDGETWVVLDAVTEAGIWPANDTAHIFAIDEPAAYQYYKIEVYATTGAFQHDSFLLLEGAAEEPDPLEVTKGNKQTVKEGSAVSFTTANAVITGVKVDGTGLNSDQYTVSDDGVVTLSADFVATLAAGKHTVVFEALTQTAEATFTIKAATPAPTGDSAAIVLVIVSVLALAGVAIASKKRAFQK